MPDEKRSKGVEQKPPTPADNIPQLKNGQIGADTEQIRQKEDENRITELEDRMGRAEKVMAWLTGAIALFALGSVIVGFLQWNVMQGQLNEMRREQEAYVAPESLTAQNFPDGQIPGFVLGFRNYGRDTATRIFGNATITITKTAIDWNMNFFPTLGTQLQQLQPDEKGNFTLPAIPSNMMRFRWVTLGAPWLQYKEAIKSGTEHLYIWGFVGYSGSDGRFLSSQRFCFVYNTSPDRPITVGSPFDTCTIGND